MTPLRIGVVGLGYWGPNLARNFDSLPDVELAWLCDARPEALERVGAAHPRAQRTTEIDELLTDGAVALAAPVPPRHGANSPLNAGQPAAGSRRPRCRRTRCG